MEKIIQILLSILTMVGCVTPVLMTNDNKKIEVKEENEKDDEIEIEVYNCERLDHLGALHISTKISLYIEDNLLTKTVGDYLYACSDANSSDCLPVTLKLNSCTWLDEKNCVYSSETTNKKVEYKINPVSNGYAMFLNEEIIYNNVDYKEEIQEYEAEGYECNIFQ